MFLLLLCRLSSKPFSHLCAKNAKEIPLSLKVSFFRHGSFKNSPVSKLQVSQFSENNSSSLLKSDPIFLYHPFDQGYFLDFLMRIGDHFDRHRRQVLRRIISMFFFPYDERTSTCQNKKRTLYSIKNCRVGRHVILKY